MKLLKSGDLVGYIKARQARQIRALRQAQKIVPELAVIETEADQFTSILKHYAADILMGIRTCATSIADNSSLTEDSTSLGIFDTTNQKDIVAEKDVGGSREDSPYDSPVAIAVMWLLAGFNIELRGKRIVLLGQELSTRPLERMMVDAGLSVTRAESRDAGDIAADILVLFEAEMGPSPEEIAKSSAVVVDARMLPIDCHDVLCDASFPQLVAAALCDNVIRAASRRFQRA